MLNPRRVYLVQRFVKDNEGNYIVCIAEEGEKGYYLCDFNWGPDFEEAERVCEEMNERMGYSRREVFEVVLSTMRGTFR